jgi:hypothetical protein
MKRVTMRVISVTAVANARTQSSAVQLRLQFKEEVMRALLPIGILVLSLGASCDAGTGPNPSDVPGYLISSVRIEPSSDTIFIPAIPRSFDRVVFSATAIGRNGQPLNVSEFAWTSSNPAVATVSASGVVTPLTTGSVEIRASADKIGRATLLILPATMTITITPAVDTIFIGSTVTAADTVRLQATARNLAGAIVGGLTFDWTSSLPAVATVDATGLVRAVAAGVTDINVSSNGHNASARVHVIQTVSQSR